MFTRKLQAAARMLLGGVVLIGSASLPASAEETNRSEQAQMQALSGERFARFHRMLLPQDGELQWMNVSWRTSITQARREAAVENKPLLIFADTGAGFADALGLC